MDNTAKAVGASALCKHQELQDISLEGRDQNAGSFGAEKISTLDQGHATSQELLSVHAFLLSCTVA